MLQVLHPFEESLASNSLTLWLFSLWLSPNSTNNFFSSYLISGLWLQAAFHSPPTIFWHRHQTSNLPWVVCADEFSIQLIFFSFSFCLLKLYVVHMLKSNWMELNLACREVCTTLILYGVFQAAILWRKSIEHWTEKSH